MSKKLTDKIWRGEYVEFSDLPPARGRVKSIPHSEGHIVVVQAADLVNTRKVIPDQREPERASSLLAYMAEVARASMKYSIMGCLRQKLQAGSGGVRTQGLVQYRAKHLLPVFYRNAYQSGGLVQAL